ncbi:MAG: U32 family peptidase [Candidatus Gastranaerophilales bacterium]|nr:U32 family peptidase [Candidatus Gastranaerophilales bacterium]
MQKLELLSPAQNYSCAISAINCGADAIYIGANNFGARKNAYNSIEDIEKIIKYAHLFNVKVYVTINTILDDNELKECEKLIQKLYEIQTDAIIIQDFGILNLSLENKLPPIVLHMSTQCDNRTIEKAKFFEDIGIKRIILARELPIETIEKIRKNTSIELEHFIHGALCVSYSGQCYMSCFIGNRSANRGECAQACRKKYSLINSKGEYLAKNSYLLSLKDNNLSNHLDKLIKAGVISFKIEGRLKDENYVKNTVLYYHNLLKNYPRKSKGRIIQDFTPNPEKTFNRGFCEDYLFNKKDNIYNFITPKSIGEYIGEVISCNDKCFVIKTKKEINSQDGLCFILNNELNGCLVNNIEKTKDGIKVYPNKKLQLKKGEKIYRNIDTKFNKTLENSKTVRKLDIEFIVEKNKLIVQDFENNKIEYTFKDFEMAQNNEKMKENFLKSISKTQDTPYFVEKIEFKTKDLPFIPISKLNEIRREILEALNEKILSKYKTKKQKPIDIAQFPTRQGDYRLNVHNKKAKEFYELCGCEVIENSFESTKNRENKELMRTKHCLKRAFLGCDKNDALFLQDEKGVQYPLCFDCKNCEMVILSPSK